MSRATPSGEGLSGKSVGVMRIIFLELCACLLACYFCSTPPRGKKTRTARELGYNTSAMSGHIVLASGDAGRARSCPPYCGAGERPKLSICSKSCKPARWETLRPATITAACLSGEPVKPLEALSACYIGCLLALMGARLASSICLPLSVNSPAAKHLGFLATLVAGSGRQRLGIALLAADGLIISQTDIASTPFLIFFSKTFQHFRKTLQLSTLHAPKNLPKLSALPRQAHQSPQR